MDEIMLTNKVLDISDMTEESKIPMSLGISENDTKLGKQFCKELIQTVIDARIPKDIKNKPEILRLVQLQSSFEEFTLQGMFAVVAQALKLLNQLTTEDAIYTPEGLIDSFKLQGVLATQQQVMNLLQQFNMHIRRLPQVLTDMLHDAEYTQVIECSAVDVTTSKSGFTTSKSIADLMLDAKHQLAQHVEEPYIPVSEPKPEPKDSEEIDYNTDETIEL